MQLIQKDSGISTIIRKHLFLNI